MSQITNKQIIALRTAAAKVFRDDEEYHMWLAQNFDGICSTKDLSSADARQAITLLRKTLNYSASGRFSKVYTGQGKKGSAASMLTPDQAAKIGALCGLLGWHENRGRLFGFIERQTGKKCDVQMLLNYEAQKLIIGMQKLIAGSDSELYRFLNTLKADDLQRQAVQDVLHDIKKKVVSA